MSDKRDKRGYGTVCRLVLATMMLGVLPLRAAHAADVLLNEFAAANKTLLTDEDGDASDWVELYNNSTTTINLNGWYLTDDADNLDKWRFPSTDLPAHGFLIVFCSDKDRRVSGLELHTNFRLSADGEYLALVRPDGITVEHAYAPEFPPQFDDMTYGVRWNGSNRTYVATGATCRAIVPTDASAGTNWLKRTGFDDGAWLSGTTGVGYDAARFPQYTDLIGLDVKSLMYESRPGAYTRIPFSVAGAASAGTITLRMKYDDGFVAYLNGTRIAAANAPATPAWDSLATADHADANAMRFESFELPATPGLLVDGQNLLAIQGMNVDASSSDFLVLPELDIETVVPDPGAAPRYFTAATPGWPNRTGYGGVSGPPLFSRPAGTCTTNFNLMLSSAVPGTEIRYTVDGGEPGESSSLYTSPLAIGATTVVRARAYEPDMLPGATVSRIYVFVAADAATFTSDLPIVIVDNLGVADIPEFEPKQLAVLAIFEPGAGRAGLTASPALTQRVAIRRRGETSLRPTYQKPNLAVEARSETDDDANIEPLGFPAESDFILHAPYSFDRSLLRNAFIYNLSRAVGPYATRTHFCEVFINADGGPIAASDYAGVYVLMERIKRDDKRVDIEQLDADDITEPKIDGGYIFKIDKPDPGKTAFTAGGQDSMYYVEPPEEEIAPEQSQWLQAYIDAFGTALNSANFTDPETGYRQYLDVAPSVEHHILNTLAKNVDALRLSTFIHKSRYGKLTYGPIWDFDRSMESTDPRDDAWNTWDAPNGTQFFDYGWWDRLFRDPDFWQAWIDRWQELRDGELATSNIAARIDGMAAEVAEAQVRNFQRWTAVYPRTSWEWEVNHLKEWLSYRLGWIDDALIDRPAATPAAGSVAPGAAFTFSVPAGATVYYTLDGSDPRLYGGAVSPAAIAYVAGHPVPISGNVVVKARATDGSAFTTAPGDAPWSGLRQTVYIVDAPPLEVTEVMYHPRNATAAEAAAGFSSSDFEFVEIHNASDAPVSLAGLQLTKGADYDSTRSTTLSLDAGAYAVIVGNREAFDMRYASAGAYVIGEFDGDLSDDGETLVLELAGVGTLLSFTYEDARGWPPAADGAGHSLVPKSPDVITSHALDYGGNWRQSAAIDGSPGRADPAPSRTLVLNEVAAHTDYSNPANPQYDSNDWMELLNLNAQPLALSTNWYLSDDPDDLRKWNIPADTVIPANGYLLIDELTGFHHPIDSGFGLDKAGESVFLSYLPGTADDRVADVVRFKGQENGTSLGRYPNGSGDWMMLELSPNATNPPPAAHVIISELMYHPAEAAPDEEPAGEFVELLNPTAAPVALWNESGPWRLDGIGFTFPADTTLAAGERLVVVPFAPTDTTALAAFRARYGVTDAIRVLGPYGGKLSDRGERLALERPQASDDPSRPEDVSWVIVDEVIYFDAAPWPEGCDGEGLSLGRNSLTGAGVNPANWNAVFPTPGEPATTVAIIRPLAGSELWTPLDDQTADVWVDPAQLRGNLHVELFADGRSLGVATQAPYSISLASLTHEQTVALVAIARDAGGTLYTSSTNVVRLYGPPADANAHYRMRIDFTGYDRATTLENFPALVRFDPAATGGFDYAQFADPAAATDLRFADAAEERSLPYDIERWTTTGVSTVWVRVPRLAPATTRIWAYWGNPALAAAGRPSYATNGATWANEYAAVWHMAGAADASGAGCALTVYGATPDEGAAGQALAFGGNEDYAEPSIDPAFYGEHINALTVTAWTRPASSHDGAVIGAGPYGSALLVQGSTGRWPKWVAGVGAVSNSVLDLAVGAWQHVALILNAGQASAIRDGVQAVTVGTYTPFAPLHRPLIACINGDAGRSAYFNGRLDELRIATTVRSADWIWAECRTVGDAAFAAREIVPPADSDADHDGLYDAWETHFFGGTDTPLGGASEDADGDGVSNGNEYLAGTDPTNAASFLVVTIAPRTDGVVVNLLGGGAATGPMAPGASRYYTLEAATDLLSGAAWCGVASFTNMPAGFAAHTNPPAAPYRYFRGEARLETP